MTYPIGDEFNDPAGRWDEYAPWDGTEASDSVKGFLSTQEHVDLRSFRSLGQLDQSSDPRPQTSLEKVPQSVLDNETQTQMETTILNAQVANAGTEDWCYNAYFFTALALGPKLYWRLDESTGTTANDASGNGNAGTYSGGVTLGATGGLAGDSDTAVNLNNSATGLVVANSYAPYVVGSQRTFVGIAFRNATTDADGIFGSSVGTTSHGPLLQLASGSENVSWEADGFSGSNAVTWSAAWPGISEWVHWALTYNDETLIAELFINGVSKGTRLMPVGYFGVANAFFRVGSSGSPFNGDMDEVTVYEEILTASQIAGLATQAAVVFSGLNTLTVGEISGRGGWSGLTTSTASGGVDATLFSCLSNPIDISPGTKLSMIFPDYSSWDTDSYVQMTSDPIGAFGTGHDSAQVTFASNTVSMPELRLNVSAFANSGFDDTKVTGIRIRLHNAVAPGSGHNITVMAIRSVTTGWEVSWIDFDTVLGALVHPVSLDGNDTTGVVGKAFQFVRGDESKSDPIPADLAVNMYFYPGGLTTPNDATGSCAGSSGTSTAYNTVGFILRETKNTSGGTGSHIEVGLNFTDTDTNFYAQRVDTTGGSPGTPTTSGVFTTSVGGPLDPSKKFLLSVQIQGTQILPKLYTVNSDNSIIELQWQAPNTITNAAYLYRNGRVGFLGNLVSRDAFIDAIEAAPTNFAELITQPYNSRTPVDGAQLAAVYASDLNLFTGMSGANLVLDTIKTISGNGAYRTSGAMQTNTFLADDWTQMYLKLAIWVPSGVTLANQPEILLNVGATQQELFTGALKPAQWNQLYFDLGVFRNLLTGTANYSFTIQPGNNPDQPLGLYWVDETTIGRRRVSWAIRANPNNQWREFKEAANNPVGAVHFPHDERGTALQLKADALTDDAWVASFHLFPRYAQLGLPLYDQGGTYEDFDAGQ